MLLLLIAAGVVPYWTGVVAEQQVQHFNQQLQTTTQVTLLNNQHQRGWLSSATETHLQLPATLAYFPQTPLQLHHTIAHGLYPISRPSITTTVSGKFPEYTELLKLYTRLQLDGSGSTLIGMPVVNLSDENNRFYWQGLQGEVQFDAYLQDIRANLQMPQLALTTEAGKVRLDNINLLAQFQQQALGMIPESLQFVIKSAEFVSYPADHSTIVMPTATAQAAELVLGLNSLVVNEELLTLALESGVQQGLMNNGPQGPHFISIELRHLYLPALNAIQAGLNQSFRNTPQATGAFFNVLMQQGALLLNQQPELALTRLYLNTPAGELKANGQVKLLRFQLGFLLNPMGILESATGELNAVIAHDLLTHWIAAASITDDPQLTERLINRWLADKWLEPVPNQINHYQIHLVLEAGRLAVNGEDKPLPVQF